jgi:signal transduction histidine kinase/ActR/RegA family two-component response regulator
MPGQPRTPEQDRRAMPFDLLRAAGRGDASSEGSDVTLTAARRTARFVLASQGLGALAAGIGVAALLGWLLDVDALKAVSTRGVSMKTNAAIALAAAGVALVCLAPPDASRRVRHLGRLLAVLAGVLGGLTALEHALHWDLGIDQALFTEPSGLPATSSPNRMGPPAAVAFPLVAIALLLLGRTGTGRAPSQGFALAVMVIMLVPLLGYVFGAEQLYGLARYTGIALQTASAFMLLAIGVLLARPDAGVMRRLLGNDSGGILLRRLIPAAVLVPVLFGWLRVEGQAAGLYDNEFGRTLLILAFIVVFSALTWWTSRAVQRQADARARAEAAERDMHARLMATLESERNARGIAERSNRMKDEFLATLSHELRTPLNAILGWVQLLVHEDVSGRDARRGLEAIERNSRLQLQLIEDLLDMSRIELGRVRLEVQPVDLAAAIDAAVAAAAPAAAAKQIALERRIDAAVRAVQGDPARLQQVLWNLVSNAIKFTPVGGRVTVSLRRAADSIEVAVKDTGIGIDAELLGLVFDRFRQVDASTTRRVGGLGLGLSIARQLTELHGGSLMAESAGRNRGTTFTVRLPAVTPPAPSAVPAAPPPAILASGLPARAQALASARILVVDDQPDACELLERILRDRSAEVITASSVTQAIDWLEQRDFDVVVSDISMPERDGYDLLHHVRARHGALPVIAVTAFARREDAERLLAAGFDRHVPKPVAADRLVRVIAEVVTGGSPAAGRDGTRVSGTSG